MLFPEPADALELLAERPMEPHGDYRGGLPDEPTLVTIGRPRWAPVDGPRPDEAHYVLQLACSFLPGRATVVEWARFRVQLRAADDGGGPPVAVDLSPLEVHEERQVELSLVLQPAVKFGTTADLSLGSAGAKVQRMTHIPVTTAAGLNESIVHWQMEATDQHPLVGARGFYALLALPQPARAVVVAASMVADLRTHSGRVFRAAIRERRDAPPIEQRLEPGPPR